MQSMETATVISSQYSQNTFCQLPTANCLLNLAVFVPGKKISFDWIIFGGETGSGARIMKEEWVIDIWDQCKDSKV